MKPYRNAERTRQRIRKTFAELIAEKKSIHKITVSELAERADITKTTFYYHYEDIYSVAEELETELIAELSVTLEALGREHPEDYSAYIQRALDFIAKNEESYRLAVNATDLSLFAAKLKTIFSRQLAGMAVPVGFSPDAEKRAVQVCFLVSACVDTMIEYLKGNLSTSLEGVGDAITEAINKLRREE